MTGLDGGGVGVLSLVAAFPIYFLEALTPVETVILSLSKTGRLEGAGMGGRLYASWVRLRQSCFPSVQPVDLCQAEGGSGRISQRRLSPSLQEPFPRLFTV